MEEQAEQLALYIIENRTTIRAAVKQFGVRKSMILADVSNWEGFSEW